MRPAIIILIGILIGFLIRCHRSDISLTEEQLRFVDVYTEILTMKDRQADEEIQADSMQIILRKYQFTEEEFQRQIQTLNEDPRFWEAFFRAVLDNISQSGVSPPSQSKPDFSKSGEAVRR
ncbi:MAG TPA: hypothetical protein ENN03_05475 [bacterium]|nr:hypothetical protein [bacterium]